MELTIDLPKQLYQDVSMLAKRKKKSIGKVIEQAVLREVKEFSLASNDERPLADCLDTEVLALANSKMSEAEAARQSELLEKQREEIITPFERNELDVLFRVYQVGNLRKAQAIREAVERGLIKTPDDLK